MSVNIPPIKDPLVTAALDLSVRAVSVSPLSASWVQWFSELFNALETVGLSGTTAQRPNPPPYIGCVYFDETLGKPIWVKTASVWVDATGTPV